MTALADECYALRLVPAPSGFGCWLVASATGEQVPFKEARHLHFTEGSAYLSFDDEKLGSTTWIKDILVKGLFADQAGQHYIHDSVHDITTWLDEVKDISYQRTVQVTKNSHDIPCCINRFSIPRDGAVLFWVLRDLVHAMELAVSVDYGHVWISHQWR
eukprot:9097856-Lingulodinium_polyedra.AAC.1